MRGLSNLPPGCSDADIERACGGDDDAYELEDEILERYLDACQNQSAEFRDYVIMLNCGGLETETLHELHELQAFIGIDPDDEIIN